MNVKEIFGKHYLRLRTESLIKSAMAGVMLGFGFNLLISALYWIFAIGKVWLGAVIGLPVGVLFAICMYLFKYRLTEKSVARRVDRLGLEERMITMTELCFDELENRLYSAKRCRKSLSEISEKKIKFNIPRYIIALTVITLVISISFTVLAVLALLQTVPHGKDLFRQGIDGSFEIRYSVDGGGRINGEATQNITLGGSTTPVRAVADNGWIFVFWEDGVKSPERYETDVDSDKEIKAVFKKIDSDSADEDDSDSADDLPYGSVIEEGGGGNSDELGGDNIKDGDGSGGGKWQDKNQFIDGATYYRDYLEFYYQYATGIFDSETDIPPEIIEFFETYFNGI